MNFSFAILVCIVLCATDCVHALEYEIVVKVDDKVFCCVGIVQEREDIFQLGVDGKIYLGSTGEEQEKSILAAQFDPTMKKNVSNFIRELPKSSTNLWKRVSKTTVVKNYQGTHIFSLNFECSGISDEANQEAVTNGILPKFW